MVRPFNLHYILKDKQVVPATLMEWAEWFNKPDRHVAKTNIGQYHISTVFIGLDHSFSDDGPPIVFETMIFDLDNVVDYQTRCSTWEQAEQMHLAAIAHVRTLIGATIS